jgi:hypothetical protein
VWYWGFTSHVAKKMVVTVYREMKGGGKDLEAKDVEPEAHPSQC